MKSFERIPMKWKKSTISGLMFCNIIGQNTTLWMLCLSKNLNEEFLTYTYEMEKINNFCTNILQYNWPKYNIMEVGFVQIFELRVSNVYLGNEKNQLFLD